MSAITLPAQTRDGAGKGAARAVRRSGLVPGVIYGDKKEPVLIAMDPRDLMAQMHKVGFWTQIFDVEVGKDKHHVLPRDVQFDPVSDAPIHVDFLRVTDKTQIKVNVPVHFVNEEASPGLKRGGVLNVVRHEIEVMCAAGSLPESIVVDVTGKEINDTLHISEVDLPKGVVLTIDRDFTIATLTAPSGLKSAEQAEGEGEAEGEAEE